MTEKELEQIMLAGLPIGLIIGSIVFISFYVFSKEEDWTWAAFCGTLSFAAIAIWPIAIILAVLFIIAKTLRHIVKTT